MATKTTKQNVKPKMRTRVSEFTISLGPLQWVGSLIGVCSDSKKPRFTFISPNGNAVIQQYYCEEEKKHYLPNELHKQIVQGEEETNLSQEEIKIIKASDRPNNVLALSVHPAADIDRILYPADAKAYVFSPNVKVPELRRIFNAMVKILEEGNVALLGVCNLAGNEGLFRLTVWRGNLVLQKQTYPEDIKEHDVVEIVAVDEADETWSDNHVLTKDIEAVRIMLTKQVADFDVNSYNDAISAKVYKALENPEAIQVAVVPDVQKDIASLLESLMA